MYRVFLYSSLLVLGLIVSQMVDLTPYREVLTMLTVTLLSYVMLEVGLEFEMEKGQWRKYAWDYIVAGTGAGFPWILCGAYLYSIADISIPEAMLIGRFAAPTSAGVLFSMLTAAGLASTWMFRKVRILAIFDDLDTILLLIPIQILLIGFQAGFLAVLATLIFLLVLAYRYLHLLKLPSNRLFLLIYAQIIVFFCSLFEQTFHVHLEVLLPAFALGCMLKTVHHKEEGEPDSWVYVDPLSIEAGTRLDRIMRGGFLFLVGASLPQIDVESVSVMDAIWHVAVLTILGNLGKCFPAFCYRKEANIRERLAVAIAMFPRGEVGAGVIFVALGAGITSGGVATLASLSLALNLLMTGLFIMTIKWLLTWQGEEPPEDR